MQEIADKIEPGTIIEVREEGKPADANSNDKHAHDLPELIAGGLLFIVGELLSHSMPQISAICFVIAYLILGREVLLTALKNHEDRPRDGRKLFDEPRDHRCFLCRPVWGGGRSYAFLPGR